ncbi:MAG: hypothetical protein IKC63_00640 [Clostridia bacterium]|nr:hypothetical protein [Clostridia bacterium]
MKKLFSFLLTLCLLSALLTPFSVNAAVAGSEFAYAPNVTTAPTVDGEIDEVWASVPEYVVGRIVSQDTNNNGAHRDSSSFKFRVMYSGDALYFLYEVKDNVLIANGADRYGSQSWKNDAIFLFVSEDSNDQSYGTNGKSYILSMVLDDTGESYTVHNPSGKYNKKDDSLYTTKIVEKTDSGYHAFVEAKIPLNDTSYLKNGGHITFDTQCHDPDAANGVRDAVWQWACNAATGPNGNKGQWGHIKFVEKTESIFDHHAEWRYMTGSIDAEGKAPLAPANWNTDLSVSSDWAKAEGPFGIRAPGCTKAWNTAGTAIAPDYEGDGTAENAYFWAVKEFTLTAEELLSLDGMALLSSSFHDENYTLYLNGIKLYEDNTEMALYRTHKLVENASDILKEGSNIIAISSHQTTKGYEFDMNLFATTGNTDKYPAQTSFETLSLNDGENYAMYYQTRDNADGTKDCRIVIMTDLAWLDTLSKLETVVTFTAEGKDSVTFSAEPKVVYHSLSAPNTVYVADEGVVIFGWIITDVPAEYTVTAPTAALNVQ